MEACPTSSTWREKQALHPPMAGQGRGGGTRLARVDAAGGVKVVDGSILDGEPDTFRRKHRVKGISHGKKLSLKNLTFPMMGEQNEWFWSEMNMSGLTPLLTSGYENISHGFVCAMRERWHEETSNFHLPVGEMTITLDDVACLLGIPIIGRLLSDKELTREEALEMMQTNLLFTAEAAGKELTRQGASHISFGALKTRYEEILNRCNQLLVPDTEEEQEEQARVRLACIKAFMLLLIGWTIFSGKNSKNINLFWLLALQDMDELDSWSWGGMRLAFLYEQLSLTFDSYVASCGGYMTLLVIIFVFLLFYLLDRKCLVVCIILAVI
ncbi:protein MAIN-LIKE 1-like [Medicago truncatula]|uniref:protein MAIN-LIKE 1-like n=1 Tax=Medicago truncatula TaxID=3880 RepID=UPI0019675542|nr:protein MAIN-LIKE 1-like [Medicago truncatula]